MCSAFCPSVSACLKNLPVYFCLAVYCLSIWLLFLLPTCEPVCLSACPSAYVSTRLPFRVTALPSACHLSPPGQRHELRTVSGPVGFCLVMFDCFLLLLLLQFVRFCFVWFLWTDPFSCTYSSRVRYIFTVVLGTQLKFSYLVVF